MTDKQFRIRQSARYSGTENSVDDLQVESMVKEQWQPLEVNNNTPGFLLFSYTILTCQHMYMRLNAAERALLLTRSEGELVVVADEDWILKSIKVHFSAKLRSGTPTADDIEYITGRMKVCPVSKNIQSGPEKLATLSFS
jgi:hypothetical protein